MIINMTRQVVKFFYGRREYLGYGHWKRGYWSKNVILTFIRYTVRIFAQFCPAAVTNIKQPSGKITTMRLVLLEELIDG